MRIGAVVRRMKKRLEADIGVMRVDLILVIGFNPVSSKRARADVTAKAAGNIAVIIITPDFYTIVVLRSVRFLSFSCYFLFAPKGASENVFNLLWDALAEMKQTREALLTWGPMIPFGLRC